PKAPSAAPKAAVAAPRPVSAVGTGTVAAPIPGLILKINVAVGDTVTAGQTVAIMEAMKMENNLTCAVSGVVQEIRVQKGSEVATGDVIMIIA
ncbi:biotin/lipoyl-containing protein, partial [Desulfococcus sp.]|uniref:biotin/lipoyl-containing protein n=1 Tax=Desulfococcus sp. TaxID=2025834 RepID=UPI00359451B2